MIDQLRELVKDFGNDTLLSRLSLVDQAGVNRFRTGKQTLSAENIVRVAEALGYRLTLVPGEPRSPIRVCRKCKTPMGQFDNKCKNCERLYNEILEAESKKWYVKGGITGALTVT